jgi:WD40 repeat protein
MLIRTITSLILGSALFLAIMWGTGLLPAIAKDGLTNEPEPQSQQEAKPIAEIKSRDPGPALYAMVQQPNPPPALAQEPTGIAKDPIVIANSHLQLIQTEDVPSQRDGVINLIGAEVRPEDRAKYPGQIIQIMMGNAPHFYRRLKEGDVVNEGDVVALLDDSLPRADLQSKLAKVKSAEAELTSSEKTRDESYERWQTAKNLRASKIQAMSLEDLRGAKLTYDRYVYEALSKDQAIHVAKEDLNQAKTVLDMYAIRAKIPGQIKVIKKKDGEAIKSLDTIMQITNPNRLRVDGFVEIQYASDLKKGMPITIEPTYRIPPQQTFVEHRGNINSVAISRDPKKAYIVSGSEEDNLAVVWLRSSRLPVRRYPHPAAVKVVVCTPVPGEVNACLTGDGNGQARIFDLNTDSDKPICEMKERHRKAITSAAFSPDGKTCATGSDDGVIMLWDALTGALKYSIGASEGGHTNSVTSLAFTPQSELVSAGQDTRIKIWQLGTEAAQLKNSLRRQSVSLRDVGVSPDGKYYMAERANEMRVVSLENNATAAVLRNPSQSGDFNTLAQFSPDGHMALTCAGQDGLLQLWKLDPERTHEVRQLIGERFPTTCAAISPDDSFVVAGNRAGKVLVWSLPAAKDVSRELTGVITSVDPSIDNATDPRIHITAEFDNPKDRPLASGDVVTMVARPSK